MGASLMRRIPIFLVLALSLSPACAQVQPTQGTLAQGPACILVDDAVLSSCSGSVVSVKYYGDDPNRGPIVVLSLPSGISGTADNDWGWQPLAFSSLGPFHKQYEKTTLECNAIFDIFGPGTGNPPFVGPGGGTWHHSIDINGEHKIQTQGPAPPAGQVYASLNRMFSLYPAGDYKIIVSGQATGTDRIAFSPYNAMDCREIWLRYQ